MAEVNQWLQVVREAFDAMKTAGPRPLLSRMAAAIEEASLKEDPAAMLEAAAADRASLIREELHKRLSGWDYEAKPVWSSMPPNTVVRRAEIYGLLKLPASVRDAFDKHLAPKTDDVERELVITDHQTSDWYTLEFLRDREFYWPRYREYLKTKKGMSEETLNSLHESANRVLESLAPPHSAKADPRRGLVVGYVQSGKTTNFTAVISKAIDAGYRLIIVLAGTIDLLRLQTQRRLDMELVGVENIGVNDDDPDREYQDDSAFPKKFISYGDKPRAFGAPNIKRLTSSNGDFRSIDASFQALAFDELNGREKAFSLEAIKRTNVRLIVIKKVTARLKKLVREIKNNKDVREDLPTLIIDDESDQASVNTVNPDAATLNERSKTNGAIVELLELLPRAQYVGYTATPFANVLVDPGDAADIYPRDFIISLPRPTGYMGVRDFHDLDVENGETPNKQAFVRLFEEGDETSLARAMDAFVVSGALKLFRRANDIEADFRHHTMMVHESVSNEDQFVRRDELLSMWKSAGYASTGAGPARLRKILEDDFRAVSKNREPTLPFPKDYDELKPFIAEAIKLIGSTPPVIVVNGDDGGVDPAFDTTDHVWKIIIGGAKLSRGFTVEGLTITYFRRRSKNQDTMMQMGRWFGYRGGYRDLVRLYMERGDDSNYDLYAAFESICRDEEAFRAQLTRYARPSGGAAAIKPIQVPAVVYNSFPSVMPTARNKMFNARLVQSVLSDEWRTPTNLSLKKGDVKENWSALVRLLAKRLKPMTIGKTVYLAMTVGRGEFVKFLSSLRWGGGLDILAAEREFFATNPAAVDQWVIALPQKKESGAATVDVAGVEVSTHERNLRNGVFNIFSSSSHVREIKAELSVKGGRLEGRGVVLVYPTVTQDHLLDWPYVGLSMYHPAVPATTAQAVFTVRNAKHRDDVVVKAK